MRPSGPVPGDESPDDLVRRSVRELIGAGDGSPRDGGEPPGLRCLPGQDPGGFRDPPLDGLHRLPPRGPAGEEVPDGPDRHLRCFGRDPSPEDAGRFPVQVFSAGDLPAATVVVNGVLERVEVDPRAPGLGPVALLADVRDARNLDLGAAEDPSGTETQAGMLYSWMSPPKTSCLRMSVGFGRDAEEGSAPIGVRRASPRWGLASL